MSLFCLQWQLLRVLQVIFMINGIGSSEHSVSAEGAARAEKHCVNVPVEDVPNAIMAYASAGNKVRIFCIAARCCNCEMSSWFLCSPRCILSSHLLPPFLQSCRRTDKNRSSHWERRALSFVQASFGLNLKLTIMVCRQFPPLVCNSLVS